MKQRIHIAVATQPIQNFLKSQVHPKAVYRLGVSF